MGIFKKREKGKNLDWWGNERCGGYKKENYEPCKRCKKKKEPSPTCPICGGYGDVPKGCQI